MLINIFPISIVRKSVEASFYTQKQQNQHPIQVHPNNSVELFRGDAHFAIKEPLYFSLIHPDEECCGKPFTGTLNFERDKQITKRVINQWLYNHFRTYADAVCFNKVGQLEVWVKDPNAKPNDKTTLYQCFSLVPYYDVMDQPWSLMVSYNGARATYNRPLSLLNLRTNSYSVMVEGEIVHCKKLTNRQKHLFHAAFAVVNKPLQIELGIKERRYWNPNKYKSTKEYIEYFCNEYLFKYPIEQLQLTFNQPFSSIPDSNLMKVSKGSEILVFGNNVEGTDPNKGIENNGVYRASSHSRINLFFIYFKEHEKVAERLFNILIHGVYANEAIKEPADDNAKNTLKSLINEPFTTASGQSVVFNSLSNAYNEIEAGLNRKHHNTTECHAAIFISPIPKDGVANPYHELYYQVKELLLQRNMVCQAIYFKNPHDEKFHLHIPNIAVALSAKVGGIPWKLKTFHPDNDLVVGVGAFRSYLSKERYIGSAFCFNGEGVFQEFDCYRHNDNKKLVADICKAIGHFMKNNEERPPERLIIHYYKTMRKRESDQIMQMLYTLNLNIPVYIVTINKTETCDFFAFDDSTPCLMPHSGTILRLTSGDYLLYNNAFYDSDKTSKNILFPIRVRVEKVIRNIGKTMLSNEEASDMLDKVYQFSRMYWKSVKQQNLPVTTAYPEMVAEIVPHFTNAFLPPFGKTSLWPL